MGTQLGVTVEESCGSFSVHTGSMTLCPTWGACLPAEMPHWKPWVCPIWYQWGGIHSVTKALACQDLHTSHQEEPRMVSCCYGLRHSIVFYAYSDLLCKDFQCRRQRLIQSLNRVFNDDVHVEYRQVPSMYSCVLLSSTLRIKLWENKLLQ